MTDDSALKWLLQDVLERRLHFEARDSNVLWSRLARSLIARDPQSEFWGNAAAQYADLLENADDAPGKLASDVNIAAHDFDNQLLNAFAEILAVIQLSSLGASQFLALTPILNGKTPDFLCTIADKRTALEVKNLRVHRFVENVMLTLHLDRQLKTEPDSRYTLVLQRSDRESLGRWDQAGEAELRKLLSRCGTMPRGVMQEERLSSGTKVRFRVEDTGDSRIEDFIGVNDFQSEPVSGAMRCKIKRVAECEAWPQLFSEVTADVAHRILALRWDLPHCA